MAERQTGTQQIATPELQQTVIEQLAKEIQIAADGITNLRTRTAFTIWIGPYVVLGSIVVAQKDGFAIPLQSWVFWVGFVLAVSCYLLLGHLAGRIERYSLNRSNKLRSCIIGVATTRNVDPALYFDEVLPSLIVGAYRGVFLTLLACFIGVALMVSTVEPKSATKSAASLGTVSGSSQTREPPNHALEPTGKQPPAVQR